MDMRLLGLDTSMRNVPSCTSPAIRPVATALTITISMAPQIRKNTTVCCSISLSLR